MESSLIDYLKSGQVNKFNCNYNLNTDVNISNLTLTDMDLSGLYLYGVRLNNIVFKNCKMEHVNLSHAYLINCTLEECVLDNSNLEKSTFRRSIINYSEFQDVVLSKVDFTQSNIRRSYFKSSNLLLNRYSFCEIHNNDLYDSDMQSSIIEYCIFEHNKLSSININDMNFIFSNLHHNSYGNLIYDDINIQINKINRNDKNYSHNDMLKFLVKDYEIKKAEKVAADKADECEKFPINFQICPQEGSFIGYKKLKDIEHMSLICKLEIPARAKRMNSIGSNKCRADFVKVRKIYNMKTKKVVSEGFSPTCSNEQQLKYKSGCTVKADEFDDSLTEECTSGIHFYMTEQEAMDH